MNDETTTAAILTGQSHETKGHRKSHIPLASDASQSNSRMVEFGFESTGEEVVAAYPEQVKDKICERCSQRRWSSINQTSPHHRSQLGRYWIRDSHHASERASGDVDSSWSRCPKDPTGD